jgi:hypothetical protein
VSGSKNITKITINDKNIKFSPSSCIGVTYEAPLTMGENKVVIQIEDEQNRVAEKKIMINRVVDKNKNLTLRTTLAILPFDEDKENLTSLLSKFILETERFRVAERQKLQQVIKEQKLSNSLYADKATTIKLGKILSARYSLAGEIRLGKDLEVVSRLIDNETSEVIALVDAYSPSTGKGAYRYCMSHLAKRIKQSLPLFETKVLYAKGDKVLLSKPPGVNPVTGMDFVIIKKEEDLIDLDTGVVLMPGKQYVISQAKLLEITRQGLLCILNPPNKQVEKGLTGVSK